MKLNLKDQTLQISLQEICESLSEDDRKVLMQFAVYQEQLLIAVVETVATGWAFDNGWNIGGLPEKLRFKLLPLMPTAVKELCEKLLEQRDLHKSQASKLQQLLWSVCRHWPLGHYRPEQYDLCTYGESRPWSEAEVEKYIAAEIGAEEWAAVKAQFALLGEAVAKKSEAQSCS